MSFFSVSDNSIILFPIKNTIPLRSSISVIKPFSHQDTGVLIHSGVASLASAITVINKKGTLQTKIRTTESVKENIQLNYLSFI